MTGMVKTGLLYVLFGATSVALASSDAGGTTEIPFKEIGIHAFNLLLLVAVLTYFLKDHVKDGLRGRVDSIKTELEHGEQLRTEAREQFEVLQTQLANMEDELAKMKVEAAAAADREREAILEKAVTDAAAMTALAKRKVQDEYARARAALRREAADLAVKMAADKASKTIEAADQKRLSEEVLETVQAQGVSNG